jgi:GT2 family glycosyltransferase
MIDVSIIIVNHNTRDLALQCIKSVNAQTNKSRIEIYFVDNASSDGSAAAVKAAFPGVQVFANSTNVNFSAANNQVIPLTRGRYVLLLNPDTIVLDSAVDILADYLDQHADVGIVGAKMFDEHLRPWKYETWQRNAITYLLQHAYLRLRGDAGTREVECLSGACLMIRKMVIHQIGLLDRFMYGEDMDWCLRARRRGWKVVHLGAARIVHFWGVASTRPDRIAWRIVTGRQSKLYYARKHHGAMGYYAMALVLASECILKIGVYALCELRAGREPGSMAPVKRLGYQRLLRMIIGGKAIDEATASFTGGPKADRAVRHAQQVPCE